MDSVAVSELNRRPRRCSTGSRPANRLRSVNTDGQSRAFRRPCRQRERPSLTAWSRRAGRLVAA